MILRSPLIRRSVATRWDRSNQLMTLEWDGKSEIGSKEDLGAQIEALKLPPSMTCIGEYLHDPPKKWWRRYRPSLVRWFSLEGSLELAKDQVLVCLRNAGLTYHVDTVSGTVISASNGFYMIFVVFDQPMIAKNPHAPLGTKVEVVARLVRGL